MSRVITFSRNYPAYHPKAGQPTYFVEKIWNSIGWEEVAGQEIFNRLHSANGGSEESIQDFLNSLSTAFFDPKYHTIRDGHRWKIGDYFSPRVWSGKPYASKQITFAQDIQIKKVWSISFSRDKDGNGMVFYIDGEEIGADTVGAMARNDGLSFVDLIHWFPKSFVGQVICWSEEINYI